MDDDEAPTVGGIHLSRVAGRRTIEQLAQEIDDTGEAITAQEALSDKQPTDPLDPDYDQGKVDELVSNAAQLRSYLEWLHAAVAAAKCDAATVLQCAFRTRQARRRFHRVLQRAYEKVYDFEQEAYFYFNKRSGATSWDAPACLKHDFFASDIENVGTFGKPSGFDPSSQHAQDEEELNRLARLKKTEKGGPRGNRIEEWTAQQVAEWFEEVTLDQFQYKWKEGAIEEITTQEINGAVLATLEIGDFKELGVLSHLHGKRMLVKLNHVRMRLAREQERERREAGGEYMYSDEEGGSDIEYSSSDDEGYSDDEESASGSSGSGDSDDDDAASGAGSDEEDDLTPEQLAEMRTDAENISIEVLFAGDNERFPQRGALVSVQYTSFLADGTEFDSSRHRGHAFEFTLGAGQVIKGWERGLPMMSFGERAMLTVSPRYAYGALGLPPIIKPHSALSFDIELISWKTRPAWCKPLIMAEEDVMTSDKDLAFWDPASLVEDDAPKEFEQTDED